LCPLVVSHGLSSKSNCGVCYRYCCQWSWRYLSVVAWSINGGNERENAKINDIQWRLDNEEHN
jgi:hypothetical protein